MHSKEDETIAIMGLPPVIDIPGQPTVGRIEIHEDAGTLADLLDATLCANCKIVTVKRDKCISDDFPKPICPPETPDD